MSRLPLHRRRSRVFDEETASARREAAHGHGHHSRKRQTRLESLDKASAGVVSAPHKFKMERIERLYLQLRDSVTHAMSNLLGANVEVGCTACICLSPVACECDPMYSAARDPAPRSPNTLPSLHLCPSTTHSYRCLGWAEPRHQYGIPPGCRGPPRLYRSPQQGHSAAHALTAPVEMW